MTDLTSLGIVLGATFGGGVIAHAVTATRAKNRRTSEIAYVRLLAEKNGLELLTCAHILHSKGQISERALAEIERDYKLTLEVE